MPSSSDVERLWEETLVALDEGDGAGAFERVSTHVEAFGPGPETSYLLGLIALAEEAVAVAATHFADAHRRLDGWPEPLIGLAETSFRSRRLEHARSYLDEAKRRGPLTAEALALDGVIAEFEGDLAAARAAYAAANRVEPDDFPMPLAMSEAEFLDHVEQAVTRLPDTFRDALVNVAIVVEPLPSMGLLDEGDHDPEILGLYVGTPLPDRSHDGVGDFPDVIYLFQRNIERAAADLDTLRREIAITVYHEIAHAFGFDEDEVEEMGLG